MVDGLVVVEKLPTSAQLLSDAEAENLTITRMQQASDRMVVTYQYPSGRTRTFAYTTTLPMDPETEVAVIPPMPAPAPTYRVIYSEPAPVYRSYPRYAPRYYDDPFGPSLSIGLGFGRSYGGYGYGYSGGHDYYRYSGHHGHHRENHHRGHHGDTHHRGRHR